MIRALIIAAMLLSLTACATPQPSRQEFLAATTRHYDAAPGQVLDAARRLFELADGSDVVFAYPDDQTMVATRTWNFYAVIGATAARETWQIEASPDGAGSVKATANLDQQQSGMLGPTYNIPTQLVVYDLFWDRMDYLLGQRGDWPKCEDYDGRTDALCNMMAKDQMPEMAGG